MKKNNKGFSIIELAIAVALICLLMVVSVPNLLEQLPMIRLNSAMWSMGARLRMARMKAMSEGRSVIVQVNPSTRSLTISSDQNGNGMIETSEQRTYKISPSRTVSISTWPSNSGIYRPDGSFKAYSSYDASYFYTWMWVSGAGEERAVLVWPSGQVADYKWSY